MDAADHGAAAGQQARVDGDANQLFMAGRDIHLGGKDHFFRATDATFRHTARPRSLPALVEHVRARRVLVLGGEYDDRDTVARQVAWGVAEQSAGANGGAPPPVLEWNHTTDFRGLQNAMMDEETPSVVVLADVQPQEVGYALDKLRDAAAERGHHVVASTGVPREAWRLGRLEEPLWKELEEDELFDPADLAEEMARGLVGLALGDELGHDEVADGFTLGGVPLLRIAEGLGSSRAVDAFVELLRDRLKAGRLGQGGVDELVDAVRDDAGRLKKWFETSLGPAERLLALALAFFDGLFDDQFFAALERWVARIREDRDPQAQAFDYADLQRLQRFYRRVESDTAAGKLELRVRANRGHLLRAAWETQRRQVLHALRVLADLAVQSAYGRGRDGELYGSEGRRRQLRRVVSVALGELGAISPEAVEPALLRMAGDDEADVQGVAAAAVARWRRLGREAEMYARLASWQNDARIRGLVNALMEGQTTEKTRSREAYTRATVALAVGYAAEYDAPNELRPELVELIRQTAGDANPVVRKRFTGFTLKRAVALHLSQLLPDLRDFTADPGLVHPVGTALAYAWRTNPAEVEATLDAWHAECAGVDRARTDPRRVELRERLLMALAWTYGELDYEGDSTLTAEAGFTRLREMLERERHPAVRSAVVQAIALQARERFDRMEPLLQTLVGQVIPSERGELVRRLVEVYRAQRDDLEGADEHLEIGGRLVPVFIERVRPLTGIERAMLRWMRDARYPGAQRIALRATVAFVEALDGPEADEVARLKAQRQSRAPAPAWTGNVEPGWYAGRFVPWLATLGRPAYLPVVSGLLPEALAQDQALPRAFRFALNRWRSMRGDDAGVTTARTLDSALSWYARAWILLLLTGLLGFLLLVWIV